MYNSFQEPYVIKYYFGEWWLPNKSKNKIPGNLKIFSNGNYLLETIGYFKELQYKWNYQDKGHFHVKGYAYETIEKKFYRIQLMSCFTGGKTYTTSGSFNYWKTYASYFLRTTNMIAELESFNKIMITTLNLDAWINDESLKYETINKGYTVTYEGPKNREILSSNNYVIKVGNGYSLKYPNHTGFNFIYLPSFEVTYDKCISEMATRDIANKISLIN